MEQLQSTAYFTQEKPMAEIVPFRAWRYNPDIGPVKELTCPLFDVVDKEQLTLLYQHPYNSIHLSVPENKIEIPDMIQRWKSENILIQDPIPGIYVYYQYYRTLNDQQLKCRKGFICNIKLHDWSEGVVLRHESTMPYSVNDRLEILERSEMNISPTHGLYTDKELTLETYMDECISNPVYEFTDHQGVVNKLGIIQDQKVIHKFQKTLMRKSIILADGHHRYTASLSYQKKNKKNYRSGSKTIQASDYHCMYLTNTESNDITVCPTHRLINNISEFKEEDVIDKLNSYFRVELVNDPYTLTDKIAKTWHSFGIVFKDKCLVATLRPGVVKDISWNFPEEVKKLDLTVMHYFIIEKVLGIKGKDQKDSKNINFSFNFTKTILDTQKGLVQMGIITRNISIEEIKKVCYSGSTFPQKSTYFFPKAVCGLAFQSIRDEDFSLEKKLIENSNI